MRIYPGVSMVRLGVADVARSGRFYGRLGWRPSLEASSGSICFFALNNIVLALFGRVELAHDCGLEAVEQVDGTRFAGISLSQNYGSAAAVDQAFDAAIGAGGCRLVEPSQNSWGGYHGVFADPDGHVWELACNPFIELAVDGTLALPP